MTYKITHHSGFVVPGDALDLLWQRVAGMRDEVRFAKVGAGLRATWGEDRLTATERDEREEIGRRAVLDVVCEVCANAPELKSDWFAISPLR